jgi:WD40 repeat protein
MVFENDVIHSVIKFWDLRALPRRKAPGPVVALSPLGCDPTAIAAAATTTHGITCLAFNRQRSALLASSVDSKLYLYDVSGGAASASASASTASASRPSKAGGGGGGGSGWGVGRVRRLAGHRCESFFGTVSYPGSVCLLCCVLCAALIFNRFVAVKCSFSPCGRFVSSGSSTGSVFVWDTHDPALFALSEPEPAPGQAPADVQPFLEVPICEAEVSAAALRLFRLCKLVLM